MMNQIFIAIKRYRFLSMVVVVLLLTAEIFIAYKLVNAPFGRDIKMDTGKVEDFYWPVHYDDEGCLDCPKKWEVDGVELSIPFIFESPYTEELKLVKEQVSPVVEGYKNDFDLTLRLMGHINKKTEYALSSRSYDTYFDLVKSVLEGGKFWCDSMSEAMMTASLSLGRNARLIHLQTSPDGNPDYLGHYALEIWLPGLKKWVLFDPTLNVYYLYQERPATTLEIHQAYVNDKADGVKVVKDGNVYPLDTFKPFFSEVLLKKYFTHFQVIFRNDFLANGDHILTVNKSTFNYYLNWVDEKTPAFYFKQELPAFGVKIGVLFFNGIIIVFLSVGLSVNRNK